MSKLYNKIEDYCGKLTQEFELIPAKRKKELSTLSQYIQKKYDYDKMPQVNVICTHNSRRSHLGQLWLSVGAVFYGLPEIATFSGGTEATALNFRVVTALRKVGFKIEVNLPMANNPKYEIKWYKYQTAHIAFSKKYADFPNPKEHFAAVLVCTSADEGCPVVMGTDFRLFLPYDDPKAFDDTFQEAEKYAERCQQIGREMLFVMSKVKLD